MTGYTMVNHRMLNAFVERWYSETSSFHLPLGEMSIALDDVSCLLHIPIKGGFLDHGRIAKDETLEIMVNHLGVDPGEMNDELDRTGDAHDRLEYLNEIYSVEL